MEGNAHAPVFGNDANGDPIIFAGDEDFDAFSIGVIDAEGAFFGATTGSETPLMDVDGLTRFADRGCNGDSMPTAVNTSEIVVISRGSCAFTEKVTNATAAGYQAAIVMNDADRCEASVSMIAEGTIPAFFVPRPSGLSILNRTQDGGCDDSKLVADATGAGDLTMHKLAVDPIQRDRTHVSWYALGLRAVDYRPGHLHNGTGFGIKAENMHETGRYIDERGSSNWGVTVYQHEKGGTYILASERNLGLQIFSFICEEKSDADDAFYCSNPNNY